MPGRKDRGAGARRRRQQPPQPAEKPGYPAEIALARNAAELEARIVKSHRQAVAHKLTADRFAAQKAAVLKVADELIEAGEINREAFESLMQKELEDLGVVEAGLVDEVDDDGEDSQ